VAEEIEIQLIDHVGVSPMGDHVDHDQWIVKADGQHIGYLPKSEGAWLACIVAMDDDVKQQIVDAVNKRIVHDIGGIVTTPEPIEDDDEDEE
jgi:ABC-type protease/lipase transport system fused ATPase/permease subunit